MVNRLLKQYERSLWIKFDLLERTTQVDLNNVTKQVEPNELWQDCLQLLTTGEQPYLPEQRLIMIKDDTTTLISMYRLYQLHHVTKQLVQLGAIARKYGVRGVALPQSHVKNEGNNDNEDSDYCDDDFKDLMSIKQIQQSIKVYYDRLRELMNPIDEDRLKLDTVHQIK